MRPLFMSSQPFTELLFQTDEVFALTEYALSRTDRILHSVGASGAMEFLFNDFISTYSPLSCDFGDYYFKMRALVRQEFS